MMKSQSWLPCVPELAPYLTPNVIQVLKVRGKPLPFIYKALKTVCRHQECSHHIFNAPIRHLKNWHGKPCEHKETDFTRSICNCMCLIDTPITSVKIAEAFGVHDSLVWHLENDAMDRIKRRVDAMQTKEVMRSPQATRLEVLDEED